MSTRCSSRPDGVIEGRHVLVLGSGGFLGSEIARALLLTDGAVTLHVRSRGGAVELGPPVVEADLADPVRVAALLDDIRPDIIINCAALADVEACERNPDLADALNRQLPAQLATWTAGTDRRLVHVSTDAVFDGRGGPYATDTPTSPINVYGRSKRDGEVAVLGTDPFSLVARTNIVGWSPTGTRSLLEYFHSHLARDERVAGFFDIHFRPLPVHWFWPTCERFLATRTAGLVHLTGPELVSKHEFGRRVAIAFGFDPTLVVPTEGLVGSARTARPPRLDVRPSRLGGMPPRSGDLDGGLAELRQMRRARESEA